jgi:hypothetical protein
MHSLWILQLHAFETNFSGASSIPVQQEKRQGSFEITIEIARSRSQKEIQISRQTIQIQGPAQE